MKSLNRAGWVAGICLGLACEIVVAQEAVPPPRVAGWGTTSTQPAAQPAAPAPAPAPIPAPYPAPAASPPVTPTAAPAAMPPAGAQPRPATATDSGSRFGFLLGTTIEFGGDEVGRFRFTDDSSASIDAGQGAAIKAGLYWRQHRESGFELRGSAAFKYRRVSAENGDMDMSRVVLEPTAGYLAPGGFHFAAGPSFHTAIDFDMELDGDRESGNFEDAVGWTVEIGWRWIMARYTRIDYELEDYGLELDASSYGLGFVWDF